MQRDTHRKPDTESNSDSEYEVGFLPTKEQRFERTPPPARPSQGQNIYTEGSYSSAETVRSQLSSPHAPGPSTMADQEQELFLLNKIEDGMSRMPPDPNDKELIRASLKAKNTAEMRASVYRLCHRLTSTVTERHNYKMRFQIYMERQRRTNAALKRCEREIQDLRRTLRLERTGTRTLARGVRKFVQMERSRRFTLTKAEQEELREAKEIVESDEDLKEMGYEDHEMEIAE